MGGCNVNKPTGHDGNTKLTDEEFAALTLEQKKSYVSAKLVNRESKQLGTITTDEGTFILVSEDDEDLYDWAVNG